MNKFSRTFLYLKIQTFFVILKSMYFLVVFWNNFKMAWSLWKSCTYKNVALELSHILHQDSLVDILLHFLNHHFFTVCKYWELWRLFMKRFLSSLQANKLPCQNLMDASRSQEIFGSDTLLLVIKDYSRHGRQH